jgi:hypothetical protein
LFLRPNPGNSPEILLTMTLSKIRPEKPSLNKDPQIDRGTGFPTVDYPIIHVALPGDERDAPWALARSHRGSSVRDLLEEWAGARHSGRLWRMLNRRRSRRAAVRSKDE